jgi:26S proteasome regulatory subunit N1
MAQDGEPPKSVDKGKGKAVADPKKPEEVEKDKDGKPIANGTKEEPVVGGMLPALDGLDNY